MVKERFKGLAGSLMLMTAAAWVIIGCGGAGASGGATTGATTTTTGGTTNGGTTNGGTTNGGTTNGGTTGALEPIEFVYSSNETGTRNLYIAKDDGTDVRQLTDDPGIEASPAWSEAADLIAFARNGVIYTIRPDGTDEERRTNIPAATFPSFSPDGTKIAFSAPGGLYIHDLATGLDNVLLLKTAPDETMWTPVYSRDGTKIYFVFRSAGGGDFMLRRMNLDGTGIETVFTHPLTMRTPFESPDGSKLFVSRGRLLSMNLDGSNVQEVTPRVAYAASISKDGSRIIYYSGGPPDWDIYRIRPDGTDDEIVIDDDTALIEPSYPQ